MGLAHALTVVPVALMLTFIHAEGTNSRNGGIRFGGVFPVFVLCFILTSVVAAVTASLNISTSMFSPLGALDGFFVILTVYTINLGAGVMGLVGANNGPLTLNFYY